MKNGLAQTREFSLRRFQDLPPPRERRSRPSARPPLWGEFVGTTALVLLVAVATCACCDPAPWFRSDAACALETKILLRTVDRAIGEYAEKHHVYPASLETLCNPFDPTCPFHGRMVLFFFTDYVIRDGWGRPLRYRLVPDWSRPYRLRSSGRDGRLGGSGWDADLGVDDLESRGGPEDIRIAGS